MAAAARKRRLSSGDRISVRGAQGRFRKMAARLMLSTSRKNSKNCLSMASALRECVKIEEKSRRTSMVCEALAKRVCEADSMAERVLANCDVPDGGLIIRLTVSVAAGTVSRSSNEFSSRSRTGLVRMCVTPNRKASSSHSAWVVEV